MSHSSSHRLNTEPGRPWGLWLLLASGAGTVAMLAYCGIPPGRIPDEVRMPEVSGTVVAADTGKPVVGAEVIAVWTMQTPAIPTSHSSDVDARWATTDADGHFEIPSHVYKTPAWTAWDTILSGPHVTLVHRDYYDSLVDEFGAKEWPDRDVFTRYRPWAWLRPRTAVIRAERTHPVYAKAMLDIREWRTVCGETGRYSSNARCCEVIYGDPDTCCKLIYGTAGKECSRRFKRPED